MSNKEEYEDRSAPVVVPRDYTAVFLGFSMAEFGRPFPESSEPEPAIPPRTVLPDYLL